MATVGLIGLGIMGSAMAANLLKAGHRVIGYDVLPARRRAHARAGGIAAESAREVAGRAAVIVCSLPSAAALAETAAALSDDAGAARIVIETSTLPIAVKDAARRRLGAARITLLDCPLSGTGAQARVKDLVVYASGSRAAYRRVGRVLDGFARAHYFVGPFGAGSKMKFVANLLVAIHNVAAAEALVLAMKGGLDPAITLKVLADGAGSSRMLPPGLRGRSRIRARSAPCSNGWQRSDGDRSAHRVCRRFSCARPIARSSCPEWLLAARLPRWPSAERYGTGPAPGRSIGCSRPAPPPRRDSPQRRWRVCPHRSRSISRSPSPRVSRSSDTRASSTAASSGRVPMRRGVRSVPSSISRWRLPGSSGMRASVRRRC
ncbi:MAG: NAD(P)-dependent oxidoreductase [Acidobacteria bacterium]|nr:NAD(P)-dependent oxidoreductase [Acidobacteriota bacterium]